MVRWLVYMQVQRLLPSNMSQDSHVDGQEDGGRSGYKSSFRYTLSQRMAIVVTLVRRMTDDECKTWQRTQELPKDNSRLRDLYKGLEIVLAEKLRGENLPEEYIHDLIAEVDAAADGAEGVEQLMGPLQQDAVDLVLDGLQEVQKRGEHL
jgi:hypothetical protein